MVYVPLEEINVYVDAEVSVNPEVEQFHLGLSATTLAFNKAFQTREIILTNIGWDNLKFYGLKSVVPTFIITHNVPALLLPNASYIISIQFNHDVAGLVNGGIYVDVGDSYGNKYIELTGNVTE